MISNHLNLVEQHRPDAEAISERVAQFLAAGGQIDQLKVRRAIRCHRPARRK